MWIIVENGEIFEGNEHHWSDCFFTNPTKDSINIFCQDLGWKVEIVNEEQ